MSYNTNYTGAEVNALLGEISGKQDSLVSGTNIKTINDNSILGSGNIVIASGGSIPVVEVSGSSVTLQPNTLTIVTSLAPVTQNFTLATPTDDSIYNEYMLQFDAISSLGEDVALPSFVFPSEIIWVEEPVFEKNYRYQISIVNNVGRIVGVPLE